MFFIDIYLFIYYLDLFIYLLNLTVLYLSRTRRADVVLSILMLADPTALMPTLWIGTTLGSVLTMTISLPETEHRHTQPVVVATSGTCA